MILVTGASGFIGKHLLAQLIAKEGKENVVALTAAPIQNCRFLLHNGYNFPDNFFEVSGYDSIHTIIHAGASMPKSSKDVDDAILAFQNIRSTVKLLSCTLPQLQKFIFISTVDVYAETDLLTENTPVKPLSLYGHSKFYCEKMVEAWANANTKTIQILRLGHVYGPGEEAFQKIIPIAFKRLLKGEPLQLWGTGSEERSFLYLNDATNAIIAAVNCPQYIKPTNIIGSEQISVKDLLALILSITNKNVGIQTQSSTHTPRNIIADNSKMKEYLVAPTTTLRQGLSIEWKYFQSLLNENIL